jgi:8-oxo-dGTP pyrophosphatase MutT (NUDIX family)
LTVSEVQPVDAATVILFRAAPEGFECLMLRRHAKSDFAADVYVFPGGRVDDGDRQAPRGSVGPTSLRHWYGSPSPFDELLSFRVAAIREAFEEAGILLAWTEDDTIVRFETPERRDQFERYRRSVLQGARTIFFVAQQENLRLAVDSLHPFSRWITPPVMPRRFDTYFFVAPMPEGQEPLHDKHETVASSWISPRDALLRYRAGDFPLVFATEKHLQRLAGFDSVAALIESTRTTDLTPVQPRPVSRDGATVFLIPGDDDYEDAANPE